MADETNQTYYLNLKTGNSQWNDPSEVQETVEVDMQDTARHLFEEEEAEEVRSSLGVVGMLVVIATV